MGSGHSAAPEGSSDSHYDLQPPTISHRASLFAASSLEAPPKVPSDLSEFRFELRRRVSLTPNETSISIGAQIVVDRCVERHGCCTTTPLHSAEKEELADLRKEVKTLLKLGQQHRSSKVDSQSRRRRTFESNSQFIPGDLSSTNIPDDVREAFETWSRLTSEGIRKEFILRVLELSTEMDPSLGLAIKAVPQGGMLTLAKNIAHFVDSLFAVEYGRDTSAPPQFLDQSAATAVPWTPFEETFAIQVRSLGARHSMYGVTSKHFDVFSRAFLVVMAEKCNEEGDEAVVQWEQLWSSLIPLLKSGCESAEGNTCRRRHLVRQAALLFDVSQRLRQSDPQQVWSSTLDTLRSWAVGDDTLAPLTTHLSALTPEAIQFAANTAVELCRVWDKSERVADLLRSLRPRFQASGLICSKHEMLRLSEALRRSIALEPASPGACALDAFLACCGNSLMAPPLVIGGVTPSADFTCALLSCDIEGAARMWARDSKFMTKIVARFHIVVAQVASEYQGKVFRSMCEQQLLLFPTVGDALIAAMKLQLQLIRLKSFVDGFTYSPGKSDGPEHVWNKHAPRVKIAIEHASSKSLVFTVDPCDATEDCSGPSVHRCLWLLGVTCGGQITMTQSSFNALRSSPAWDAACPQAAYSMVLQKMSDKPLRHVVKWSQSTPLSSGDTVQVVSVAPEALQERIFSHRLLDRTKQLLVAEVPDRSHQCSHCVMTDKRSVVPSARSSVFRKDSSSSTTADGINGTIAAESRRSTINSVDELDDEGSPRLANRE